MQIGQSIQIGENRPFVKREGNFNGKSRGRGRKGRQEQKEFRYNPKDFEALEK